MHTEKEENLRIVKCHGRVRSSLNAIHSLIFNDFDRLEAIEISQVDD